jgi:hypothetical protein
MRLNNNILIKIDGNPVLKRTFWEADTITDSNFNIWDKQDIDLYGLLNSDFLMSDIQDEINRK